MPKSKKMSPRVPEVQRRGLHPYCALGTVYGVDRGAIAIKLTHMLLFLSFGKLMTRTDRNPLRVEKYA